MIEARYAPPSQGFTLVELVMTMLVLGIMAVVILPRFVNQTAFQTRGFVDQTLASLQYARKVAVASGRNVCVSASSGGDTLTMTIASSRGKSSVCNGGTVSNPASKWQTYSGITYSASLGTTFHGDGTAAAAPGFTVSGASIYTIDVESTGYAHCNPVSACE